MNVAKLLALPFLLTLALSALPASAEEGKRTVLIVKGYRYLEPKGGAGAEALQTGHSLCGTKCNSVSANFESLMMSGMRLVKTGEGREMRIPLDNPFLKGECACTGDEYEVDRVNYRPGTPEAKVKPD